MCLWIHFKLLSTFLPNFDDWIFVNHASWENGCIIQSAYLTDCYMIKYYKFSHNCLSYCFSFFLFLWVSFLATAFFLLYFSFFNFPILKFSNYTPSSFYLKVLSLVYQPKIFAWKNAPLFYFFPWILLFTLNFWSSHHWQIIKKKKKKICVNGNKIQTTSNFVNFTRFCSNFFFFGF